MVILVTLKYHISH